MVLSQDSPAPLLGLPAASPATIAPGQAAALSLGGKHTTSSCTNISAESEQPPQRPLEDKHVEPAMRDAHPKLPKQADLASKLAAADSTPGIKATSSAPSLSQHVASVPVATAVAACGDKSMPDRQQGNMQALQMLFPQELQPESASSDMHTPLENLSEHVAAMHSATAEQQGTAKVSLPNHVARAASESIVYILQTMIGAAPDSSYLVIDERIFERNWHQLMHRHCFSFLNVQHGFIS